jgi:hypothetical protein
MLTRCPFWHALYNECRVLEQRQATGTWAYSNSTLSDFQFEQSDKLSTNPHEFIVYLDAFWISNSSNPLTASTPKTVKE